MKKWGWASPIKRARFRPWASKFSPAGSRESALREDRVAEKTWSDGFRRWARASAEAVEEIVSRPGSGLPTASEAEIAILLSLEKRGWRSFSGEDLFRFDANGYFPDLRVSDLEPDGPDNVSKFAQRIRQANRDLIAKGEVEKVARNWIAATEKGRLRLTAWNGFKAKIRGLSPAQFDRFMHAVLDTFGFKELTVTWQTGDGGFDGSGTLRRGGGVVRAAFKCRRERPAQQDVEEFRAAIGEDFETGIMFSAADGYWPLALAAAVRGEERPIVLLNADAVLHLMEREAKTQRIPTQPYEAFWTIILESALCGKPS